MGFVSVTRLVLAAAVLAVAGVYVAVGARTPWDFETYYYAASAFRSHLNPYFLGSLSQLAGKSVELPFLYPPVTLALFVPFSLLPLDVAGGAWLGFKVVLLIPLAWVWKRRFLPMTDPILLLVTALLGFNLALLWDLRTGNVAVLESLLLWLGLGSYVRHRTIQASCLIALGSVFKLIPAFLLGLLGLKPRSRVWWVAATVSIALLVLSVTIPSHLSAEWRRAVAEAFSATRPMGDINPSALGVADWIATRLHVRAGRGIPLALIFYIVYCATVVIASSPALLRTRKSGSDLEHVVMAVLLWLLLSPRVMIYSYIMAIVPVLYAIETRIPWRAGRLLAVLLVVSQGVVRLLPGQPPAQLAPLSFLIVLGTWALMVWGPEEAPDFTQALAVEHPPSGADPRPAPAGR